MSPMEMTFCPFGNPITGLCIIIRTDVILRQCDVWEGLALSSEPWVGGAGVAEPAGSKMPEVELSVSWKGRLTSASLRVDIDKSTACRDLVGQLVDEGWGRKGACHLVERWHRCGKYIYDKDMSPTCSPSGSISF